jgi:branched-chain amino acid transport system ATP-binding protein
MSTAPILELIDLCAGYGNAPIVHDFSTRLAPGTVSTLIGGNGAGKSTLLRAIFGANRWISGQVVFDGEAIEQLGPAERMQRGIGFVPQGRCNFPRMSVAENLKIGCYLLPRRRHRGAIERVTALFSVLTRKWSESAGNLSGGEQQILETAMVLLSDPKLLLLDEPSLGLSPKMQTEIFGLARGIALAGVTILIVEQNVHGALAVSDTAIVMELGRKFLEGPATQVRDDPRIREAYLGGNIKEKQSA